MKRNLLKLIKTAIFVAFIVLVTTLWWNIFSNGGILLPQQPSKLPRLHDDQQPPQLAQRPVSGPLHTEYPDYEFIREVINNSMKCYQLSGMVVAVVKDGKTVFSGGFGETQPGSGVKVTPDTRFMIASLTKSFAAALMVNVFADNPRNISFDLRTPLRDILGNDFRFGDDERTKYASAEDLLSHRINIIRNQWPRLNPDLSGYDILNRSRYFKVRDTFRDQALYSSITYTLAAAITEFLGERSWEELTTERLLKPLGLTSTGFISTTNFTDEDVAKPYTYLEGRVGPIDPKFAKVWNSRCGSGCMVSTVGDMTKWMNTLLSLGKNSTGHQVLPQDQVETLISIRTYLKSYNRNRIHRPIFPECSIANTYGLGLRRGYYRGHKIISHSGSTPGISSMMLMYPMDNLGIYIAMNGDDYRYYYRLALIHYISDVMLGYEPWLNSSTVCSFPEPWQPRRSMVFMKYNTRLKARLPLDRYIGTYRHLTYGDLVVSLNSTINVLQGVYGIGSWQLYPQIGDNIFFGKGFNATHFWNVPKWQFKTSRTDSRKIIGLKVIGFETFAPPEFLRVVSNS